MNEYFVYALVDPRDGSIFYIGKGKGDRPRQHLVESLRYKNDTKNAINPHKTRKILNILNAGYDSYDILYLHENLSEEQAFELEKYEIANHTNLTNIGKGGDVWVTKSIEGRDGSWCWSGRLPQMGDEQFLDLVNNNRKLYGLAESKYAQSELSKAACLLDDEMQYEI